MILKCSDGGIGLWWFAARTASLATIDRAHFFVSSRM